MPASPVVQYLADLLHTKAAERPSLQTIERDLQRLFAAPESAATHLIERTTIERERVIEACAVLQLDAALTMELVITASHVNATVLDPQRRSGPPLGVRLRIEAPKSMPTIAVGDTAAEVAALRDEVRARTDQHQEF